MLLFFLFVKLVSWLCDLGAQVTKSFENIRIQCCHVIYWKNYTL